MMAIRKKQKKEHGLTLNTGGIPIVRMDRETVGSLGKKLRSTDEEVEKLKTALAKLIQRVDDLEDA
jgi:hypothetical protein